MASLPLPCSTPPSIRSTPSTIPLFSKQSHFITNARTNRNLSVSCQNQSDDQNAEASSQGKVDRRNMLFGLGGLYGASNLINTPGATSAPIAPPDLKKCNTPKNLNKNGEELTGVKCCTPPSTIVDYKIPQVLGPPRLRPSAHRLTPEYLLKYKTAIDRMRRLPKDDPRSFQAQANVHCAYCNAVYNQVGFEDQKLELQVHNSWLFFPFHRWYLYFYERILGSLIDDPTFALPFWNWDNPKGMTMPPIFADPKSSLYNAKRNPDNIKPNAILDLGLTGNKDPLQVVSNNLTIMYSEMIRGNTSAEDFMGKAYRAGSTSAGPGASERGSHTSAHVWMGDPASPSGEDMGNFYSAGRDPLFYCHHSNVDRMWTLWQYFLPSSKVPDKRITDPDFLNAAFLFYDENKQLVRVTVKDSLDNLRMGYEYERIDLPWLDYRPPRQTAAAKIKRVGVKTPKAETLFPLKLDKIVRVEVQKTVKGVPPKDTDELLLLENIVLDTSKFLKFDVFVNDEDDDVNQLDKAAYLGTYAQVPHSTNDQSATTSIRLKLTDLYEDIDVTDDDSIVISLVPRHQGPGVTIGGIKIISAPKPKAQGA